jgi:hypothetical protein
MWTALTDPLRDGDLELSDSGTRLDQAAARALTQRIREAADHVCRLLLEAHDRGAASALGYGSWAAYVRAEFHLSRSRSYQLLDQARVIHTIEETIGVSRILDISPFAAKQLKPHLSDVVEAVRVHTRGAPRARIALIAARVVQEERRRIATAAGPPEPISPGAHLALAPADAGTVAQGDGTLPGGDDPPLGHQAPLADALRTLARMPPVHRTVAHLPQGVEDVVPCLTDARAALEWLHLFVEEWASRHASEPLPPSA